MKLNKDKLSTLVNILFLLILAIFLFMLFVNSMVKPMGHDEHMYCTAGALMAKGKMIYRDFSYVAQLPYHPLLCAALYKIFNTTHYLLTTRLLSSLCDMLTLICIVSIYKRIFDDFKITGALLSLAAAALYIFNPFVNYANGFAWNHDLVIFCVIASFWIFMTTDFNHKSKYRRTAVIGALLTFATFTRVTTALVQLLFFIFLFLQPADTKRQRLKTILPFLIGTAVVSIWPLWVIAQAPYSFLLNVFAIPVLNGEWIYRNSFFYGKFEMAFAFVTTDTCFILITIAVYLFIALMINCRKIILNNARIIIFAILLTAVFFIIAFIPITMWTQYFAMPVPFMIISFAYPLLYLKKITNKWYFKMATALVAACVFITVCSNFFVILRIPRLFRLQNWRPIALHKVSKDIAENTKNPKLILTLSPLYALEGGCDIYNEFSAGPFVYRISDSLTKYDLQTTNTAGLEELNTLVENHPPSAVIIGAEGQLLEDTFFMAAGLDDKNIWESKKCGKHIVGFFRR